MKQAPAALLVLANLLLANLVLPLAAQPAPDAPPPPDTREERQRNSAAKLAGLLRFVAASCPELKPNTPMFRTVVTRLGVDPDDLAGGELVLRVKAYAEIYERDVPGNCAKATANFGEAGTTMPGLIGKP